MLSARSRRYSGRFPRIPPPAARGDGLRGGEDRRDRAFRPRRRGALRAPRARRRGLRHQLVRAAREHGGPPARRERIRAGRGERHRSWLGRLPDRRGRSPVRSRHRFPLRPGDHEAAGCRARRVHDGRGRCQAWQLLAAGPLLTARILIWNLFASKTTLEELREHLPSLPDGDYWISNNAQDRFGLISFGDRPPDLAEVQELIGDEPAVAEEFDVE